VVLPRFYKNNASAPLTLRREACISIWAREGDHLLNSKEFLLDEARFEYE
jgi:hypothetical protein